jgi:ribonuclease HI
VGAAAIRIQERSKHLVQQSNHRLVFHHNQVEWAPNDFELNVEANEAWGQVMEASEKVGALVWVMAPSVRASEAPSLATSI